MTLRDMLETYAEHARNAKGLHYVPSFNNNDLNTQDDLIAEEESSGSLAMPEQPSPHTSMSGTPTAARATNKADDWPQFSSAMDVHKVNVHDYTRDARHLMDKSSGSIWQEIIKAEQLKERTFKELDRNNDGYLSPTEILIGLRTTREKAAQMVKEADKDGDGMISMDEYKDMLSKFGSE